MSMLQWGAAGLLALVYGGSGLFELPQWRRFAPDFVALGYPRSWAVVTPALKIVATALTLWPATRLFGLGLCTLIAVAAVASVWRVGQRRMYLPSAATLVVTLACVAVLLTRQAP